ncbi:MAG TPA: zf-HC2 domain-containing protein [Candidatus Deferrimicrobiaceae bacterium]|jgi:anti-sigma factor RsiW
MDCGKAGKVLQDEIDGRLPPAESAEVRRHVESCAACAAEADEYRRIGEMLRAWTAARAAEKEPQLDVLWPRVRAGIEEGKPGKSGALSIRKWLWLPVAAALAIGAIVFYPSAVNRAPFHPTSFKVTVEDLESDTATVALVDKGDDLPRVIWIIENDKT